MKRGEVSDFVDPTYILSLTQQLIRIPSESGDHKRSKDRIPLVTLIGNQFKALGLDTTLITAVEGRPNIYVEVRGYGEGPTLVFRAAAGTIEVTDMHMEMWATDPFSPYVKDGKLYVE